MIKVSVMYPNKAGARFNHEYYANTHMPLVKSKMGDACLFYTVDKGLGGGVPGEPPAYIAMCHIFCESAESFAASFNPHAQAILADIPNYTDLQPVLQISEVVIGHPGT
ncbi:EthD family reductase [Limnobacter sp.]|uniref:EthD family reductase n=1 Tax=Limnobacter sp. TaxID=2003368 RepID=UPI0025859BEC|nr:EthD family reductase [Limnobacter sp.]